MTMVGGLAHRVTGTLRNILDDLAADPRLLALGLIAVQAQMAVVFSFIDERHDRDGLREMTFAAIEPILGLYQAIHNRWDDIRSGMAWGGGS